MRPGGPHQRVLVGRAEEHVAQRDRAARVQAEQVGGRQDPAHAVALEHREVLAAGGEHVDGRLDRELGPAARSAPDIRARARTGASSEHPSTATAARTSASVTIPSSVVRPGGPAAPRPRRGPSRAAAVRSGSSGSQNTGAAHDRRHGRGADVEQPVHGVARVGQALSHRVRDVGRAGLGPEDPASGLRAEQGAHVRARARAR